MGVFVFLVFGGFWLMGRFWELGREAMILGHSFCYFFLLEEEGTLLLVRFLVLVVKSFVRAKWGGLKFWEVSRVG